jgi:hypothetical protein
VFVGALALHTTDHLRRGLDASPVPVQVIGNTQLVLAAVTVWFVARRTPSAASWAIALGFGSAVGFTLSHVLPHWGPLSDSFVGVRRGAGVTWYSWVTAVAEIAAGAVLGAAGWRHRTPRRAPAASH